jgi:hypothetical protein
MPHAYTLTSGSRSEKLWLIGFKYQTAHSALTWRGHGFAISLLSARALLDVSLSEKSEGAGNAGCAMHPMASRAKVKKHASIVTTGSPDRSGIPCTMVLRLTPRSPRRSGLFVTVAGAMDQHRRQLDSSLEESGPHGFAVRL